MVRSTVMMRVVPRGLSWLVLIGVVTGTGRYWSCFVCDGNGMVLVVKALTVMVWFAVCFWLVSSFGLLTVISLIG